MMDWKKMLKARIESEGGSIVSEKMKMAADIGVSERMISRWISGDSNPRKRHVDALELYDPSLGPALRQAFPDYYISMEEEVRNLTGPFYSRVHEALEFVPKDDAFRPISQMVIDLLVNQLDANTAPESDSGFMAVMGQLQTLPEETKASYLRMWSWSGQGTGIWFEQPVRATFVLGKMTLSGRAVAQGEIALYPRDIQKIANVPITHLDRIKSGAAYPLRFGSQLAGVIYMASTERDFFTRYRREVIMHYARMLSLVFRERDFYDRAQIDFDIPESDAAQQYLERIALEHPAKSQEEIIAIAVANIQNVNRTEQ